MPTWATANNLEVHPLPDALKGFNWIEDMLVQLVRPLQVPIHSVVHTRGC